MYDFGFFSRPAGGDLQYVQVQTTTAMKFHQHPRCNSASNLERSWKTRLKEFSLVLSNDVLTVSSVAHHYRSCIPSCNKYHKTKSWQQLHLRISHTRSYAVKITKGEKPSFFHIVSNRKLTAQVTHFCVSTKRLLILQPVNNNHNQPKSKKAFHSANLKPYYPIFFGWRQQAKLP